VKNCWNYRRSGCIGCKMHNNRICFERNEEKKESKELRKKERKKKADN